MKNIDLWIAAISEAETLAGGERTRAGRAVGEVLLRAARIPPEKLIRGEHGKPELPGGPQFSLSHHSGSFAVLAVSDAPMGVDIEPVTARKPIIPRRFLLPDELEWLGEDPSPERFARLWTRLEAALKADGRGFDLENRDFSVLEEGKPWYFRTVEYEGHIISCAAGEEFELCLRSEGG